jgi:MoaA/NifB/PqqE/SkfB family radical SAM enzyme
MPGTEHPVRHAAESPAVNHSELLHAGRALEGRCLYPFLYARVSFSGKAYFCPFIRVEVGDLTTQTLEEVWTGEPYVSLRKKLVQEQLFPVCRRCCKVELSSGPAAAPEAIPARAEMAVMGDA